MRELYFAYGSNMSTARLRARIAGATPRGAARLDAHRLAFNKPGSDGSGKANVIESARQRVWGVLFEVSRTDLSRLDRFEPGYERTASVVQVEDGSRLTAHVYRWHADTPEIAPLDWYLEHLLEGALQHSLPADYAEWLRSVDVLAQKR